MNNRTKIKVDRLSLIEKLRERQEQNEAEHAAALVEYEKAEKAYPKALHTALVAAAVKVKSGEWTRDDVADSYRSPFYKSLPDRPVKPRKAGDSLALSLAQLEIGSDDSILISGEDFARYLG